MILPQKMLCLFRSWSRREYRKERYTNMIQPQKIYYVSLEPGIEWNEGQRKIQEDNTTAEKK